MNNLLKDYELKHYIETSSKTGFNSKQLFIDIAKELYSDYNNYRTNSLNTVTSKNSSALHINNTNKLEMMTQKEDQEDSFTQPKKGCC